jgi:glycerol-3-phosphate acyltransferase PlsY
MEKYIINYILLCFICYFIGSIPTAYLIVKRKHKKDITKEGSGSVGSLNSYEITGSRSTGIVVFVLDFLKGFIPTLVLGYIFSLPLAIIFLPLVCLVVGHNFSIWIKFKGGRGLATAAGIGLIVNFWLPVIWCVLFLIVYFIKRNFHIGNIFATVLMPLVLIFSPDFFAKFTYDYSFFDYLTSQSNFEVLFAFSSSLSLVILLKHINPFLEIIRDLKKKLSE